MKSVAIIAEYNPFHNGHRYQIAEAKRRTGADIVIAIMSGQFTQRGEPALISKFHRAEMALEDCDLVVELPQFYALSYADDFAAGGIQCAKMLEADYLSYGIEHAIDSNITLTAASSKSGESYARQVGSTTLDAPNNILAYRYKVSAQELYPELQLCPVERIQNDYHDVRLTGTISSATAIRQAVFDGIHYSEALSSQSADILSSTHPVSWEDYFPLLKYAILTKSHEELKNIYMMTEGLEYRLKKYIRQAEIFKDYMMLLKTKRYTYTRLQRLLCYTLLNIQQCHAYPPIDRLRVLAMNNQGRQYLSALTDQIVTNTNQKNSGSFELEIKATAIYNLHNKSQLNEFNRPVIYKKI